MAKSEFIRNTVIEKLQFLQDSALIDSIMERNEKIYSFEEAKNALGMED
ncbi:MAG TPA: hypothetical protein PKD00_09070 [Burkholderiales bacterium]|nr:hypothetical protein [Burkholderiales bacterium]